MTDRLMGERGALLSVAYRLLGSITEAEDAVQESFARWFSLTDAEREAISNPGAWLSRVVSRICLDELRSARVRRERYVGEWLPEPVPDTAEWHRGESGTSVDPAHRVTLDESIDLAFLVILDAMTPAERVAFLLHDVFGYSFAEIADIVGRTPAACRQLASSARHRVRQERPAAVPTARRADVVHDFKKAWQAKDVGALVRLLDPSVVAVADGGGRVSASLEPVVGGEQVARFLVLLAELAGSLDLVECRVNGQPGLAARDAGEVIAVYGFEVVADHIRRLWVVRNPDKLRAWSEDRS